MGDVLEKSLFSRQPKQFEKVNSRAKSFAANYCGTIIIRDSIFGIAENYARKRDLTLEVLRYPVKDDELWAFTFVKIPVEPPIDGGEVCLPVQDGMAHVRHMQQHPQFKGIVGIS